MQKFTVEIQEFLSLLIDVEANSEDEAISIVRKMYRNEEIVLDDFDFVTTEIDVFEQ